MRCTSPRTVGFLADGKTLCWSSKKYSKEYPTFQLPCGKCISCRLERARETAVRCVHEAQMYEANSFITLTYSEENLSSSRLIYRDFQLFIKRLRKHIYETSLVEDQEKNRIGVFVTGEYGDKKKRPHWHAIVFNWRPSDLEHKYTNDRGDQVYTSSTLAKLWPQGISEVGSVTFESAGYVARYASKKLIHGKDGEHDYEPISRRSCKQAIGKKWLEKYWKELFAEGICLIDTKDGPVRCSIPRYYEKWLMKHKLPEWERYVTQIKSKIQKEAADKEAKLSLEEKKANLRRGAFKGLRMSREKSREIILEQKFNQLQKYQKDI